MTCLETSYYFATHPRGKRRPRAQRVRPRQLDHGCFKVQRSEQYLFICGHNDNELEKHLAGAAPSEGNLGLLLRRLL